MTVATNERGPVQRTTAAKLVLALYLLATILAAAFGAKADAARRHPRGYFTWKAITHYFPRSQWFRAMRIAGCETGWTYSRFEVGRAGERGIFQIHPVNWGDHYDRIGKVRGLTIRGSRLFDIDYNVRVAYLMSHAGRDWWPAWSCAHPGE